MHTVGLLQREGHVVAQLEADVATVFDDLEHRDSAALPLLTGDNEPPVIRRPGRVGVVSPHRGQELGRIIFDNLEATQRQLEELLRSDLTELFLRMEDLSYLDSSALGMLLSLNKTARISGQKIVILSPPPQICDIFTSTHLDAIFQIVQNEEAEAIQSRF